MTRSVLKFSVAVIVAALSTACGVSEPAGADDEFAGNDAERLAQQDQALIQRLAQSTGPFVIFDNPYGDGSPNPAAGIRGFVGVAFASSSSGSATYVALRVTNLPAQRVFGAHVHRLACADTKGGTHYQNAVAPTTPTDPAYANAQNEVWLDFTAHGGGQAVVIERASFLIRRNEANSIVIHTNATGVGGVAGAKLACIDVDF